jgi:hypothetical protein
MKMTRTVTAINIVLVCIIGSAHLDRSWGQRPDTAAFSNVTVVAMDSFGASVGAVRVVQFSDNRGRDFAGWRAELAGTRRL